MRAGQTQAPPTTSPASSDLATTPVPAPVGSVLDQFAAALATQARAQLLPALQSDRELQRTVGAAMGREIAKPLWVLAGVAAVYVGWRIYHARDKR